jgi:16S rRNA (uracil1498-N3)-methyltransferase
MSERFFLEQPVDSSRATLTGNEVHHLAGVMRAKVGDEITLFDGSGSEFTGRIDVLKKDRCELTIVERRDISREPAVAVIAGVALPKGERQKWLVEKLTELGVTQLVPLLTARGVAVPDERIADKLRRTVIEACKQCGRNRLMEITRPVPAVDWFAQVPAEEIRLLADPAGEPFSNLDVSPSTAARIHFAIGPEGGFTQGEVDAASAAGWQRVALGNSILRIETAAIAFAAGCLSRIASSLSVNPSPCAPRPSNTSQTPL